MLHSISDLFPLGPLEADFRWSLPRLWWVWSSLTLELRPALRAHPILLQHLACRHFQSHCLALISSRHSIKLQITYTHTHTHTHTHTFFSLYFLVFFYFFFGIFLHCAACGILLPLPGIEPVSPAMEVQNFNHWASREVPLRLHFLSLFTCQCSLSPVRTSVSVHWDELEMACLDSLQ